MSGRGWPVLAGCLTVVCGLLGWAWHGERATQRATHLELAKAQARLSAQVPPAPGRTAAAPCSEEDAGVGDIVGELGVLSEQLAAAERERDQYRVGLEQAVAELNRLSGKHQADLASASVAVSAAASATARYRGRVVPVRDPELALVGDRLQISGKLYNTGAEDAEVKCTLELLRDGQRIDTVRFPLRVSAGATQPYTEYFFFPTGGQVATYSARLSIE
jgi:hypothetical protein